MKRRGIVSGINRGGSTDRNNAVGFDKHGIKSSQNSDYSSLKSGSETEQNDAMNYALLIALYTLQGIPIGLSASIPFLIQQKIQMLTLTASAAGAASTVANTSASAAASAARLSYNANAIFALCSWPFSLKLLWAPIVDAIFSKKNW